MNDENKSADGQDKSGKPPRKKRKPSAKQRALVWMAMNLGPPVVENWLNLFNWNALRQDEKRLVLLNADTMLERISSHRNPTILALWHNRLLFGPTAYRYCKGKGAVVMVSRSFDGDLIKAVLNRFEAFQAVRGSSRSKKGRDKGGLDALNEMIEKGKEGFDLIITPDGPQGPRYKVKRGIVDLARATGFPICPASAAAQKSFTMKSWDRTVVPNPFSPCVYMVGDLITVPADADDEFIEKTRAELEERMIEMTEHVDHFYD